MNNNINILLKECGDIAEAKHLQIPDYLRVVDVLKQKGSKAQKLIKILQLPTSYIHFALYVQYPTRSNIEKLYKAYYSKIYQKNLMNYGQATY